MSTKQTEALKLALEALEGAEALLLSMGLTHLIVYGDAEKAITALREALAEQPAQQEPVAWMSKDADIVYTSIQVDGCFQHDHIPLYTTPPQRTWVGLTDEEIEAINVRFAGSRDLARLFARAIEAKLKEKNT